MPLLLNMVHWSWTRTLGCMTEHDFSVLNSSQPDRPCMAQSILTRSWPRHKLAKIPLRSLRDRGARAQWQRRWTQTWRRWAESWRAPSCTLSARSSSWHHPAAPSWQRQHPHCTPYSALPAAVYSMPTTGASMSCPILANVSSESMQAPATPCARGAEAICQSQGCRSFRHACMHSPA